VALSQAVPFGAGRTLSASRGRAAHLHHARRRLDEERSCRHRVACQDGERAPQGAHCWEDQAQPAVAGRWPRPGPRGDRLLGEVDHPPRRAGAPGRAAPSMPPPVLGQPGQLRDAQAGGVGRPPRSRRRVRPAAAKPAAAEGNGGSGPPARGGAARGGPAALPRLPVAERVPARQPRTISAANAKDGHAPRWPARRGPAATGGAGPTPAAAAAYRPALRRRPR